MKFIYGETGVSEGEGKNLLSNVPENWTFDSYKFYAFQIVTYEDCTMVINGGAPIPMRKNRGISTDIEDPSVYSVEILESGINYDWIGKAGR